MRLVRKSETVLKVLDLPVLVLGVSTLLILLGLGVAWETTRRGEISFRCERSEFGLGHCLHSRTPWLGPSHRREIEIRNIRSARLERFRGHSGQSRARAYLTTTSGRIWLDESWRSDSLRLFLSPNRAIEDEESLIAQINAFLRDESISSLEVHRDHRVTMLLWSVILGLFGFIIVGRWGTVTHCRVDSERALVRLRHWRLMIPRTLKIPLRMLSRIKVTSSRSERYFGITFVLREGGHFPLFPKMSSDRHDVERLAAELRKFSGF